jgi:hypothetical protein
MDHRPYPADQEQVRIMCGDPQALAYKWIESYLENLNSHLRREDGDEEVTLDELIDTAMSHLDESGRWGDYITRGGAFEGVDTDPMFWEKLAILKGIEIPDEKRVSFFSCSC